MIICVKNQISKYTRSLKTLIYLLIILSQATRQVANATSYKIYIITIHIFCFYKAAATLLTFANLVIKVESLLVDCRLYLICIFNKGSAFTPSAAYDTDRSRCHLRDGNHIGKLLHRHPMILRNNLSLNQGYHGIASSESEDAYLNEYDEKLKKYHIYIIMCKVNRAFLQ